MFARAYFPGRSGQIMIVPREAPSSSHEAIFGEIHARGPWGYDTHILFFYGSP
jgi:hypothetical protein